MAVQPCFAGVHEIFYRNTRQADLLHREIRSPGISILQKTSLIFSYLSVIFRYLQYNIYDSNSRATTSGCPYRGKPHRAVPTISKQGEAQTGGSRYINVISELLL